MEDSVSEDWAAWGKRVKERKGAVLSLASGEELVVHSGVVKDVSVIDLVNEEI